MARSPAQPAFAPKPPLLGWPRQAFFDGGYAWLTPNGPAIVTQTITARATKNTVNTLCDFLDGLVSCEIAARLPGLLVLHDWRSLSEIEDGARAIWTRRTRRPGNPFGACDIYVALGGNPVMRMALRAAALTIQLAQGQRAARFVDSIEPVMREHAVTPPAPDFFERWQGEVEARR